MSAKVPAFNFMKIRMASAVLSICLVIGSIVALAVNGLNLGLDFTGGTLVEVGFSEPVELSQVRASLAESGFPRASAVHFGSEKDVLIRLPDADSARVAEQIVASLGKASNHEVKLRRTEFVGPQMGDELRDEGGLALLTSLLLVMMYVSFRFQWKLSVGAVVALVHDVTITLGAFAFFGWECDLTVLAAFLALIGYSINDTIVVYDRIRENFRKMRRMDRIEIANSSLNQTLGRTLMTSGLTLLAVLALLFFGGEILRGFAMTLTIGILIGTYSSIYVATSFALWLGLDRADLLLPVKENEDGNETETP
jgi:preprotein translocase subunit SecF